MRIENRKMVFPFLMLSMFRHGENCSTLAAKLHITPQALSRRLRGLTQFQQKEIDYLIHYFNLPYEKLLEHELVDDDDHAYASGDVTQ